MRHRKGDGVFMKIDPVEAQKKMDVLIFKKAVEVVCRLNDEAWDCLNQSSDFDCGEADRKAKRKRLAEIEETVGAFAKELVWKPGYVFYHPLSDELHKLHKVSFRG